MRKLRMFNGEEALSELGVYTVRIQLQEFTFSICKDEYRRVQL